MSGTTRDRMVESAVVLLAKHGFQATSFSAVLEASKAPRGSVYHHFPEGKDQLIAAAIELAGDRAIGLVDSLDGSDAAGVVDGFMAMWRAVLLRSDFTAGCSVLAVAVSSDSGALIEQAGATFRAWRARLAGVLEAGGIPGDAAAGFAAMLIAASEGAVVLSRAQQSLEPFEAVHAQLLTAARAQLRGARG